jgi:hypothetical protein
MVAAKWTLPPEVKVWEALTAIGNGGVKFVSEGHAKVTSSLGEHRYDVFFDLEKKAIIADDNGSRWQGYLGYPSLAILMLKGLLPFEQRFAKALAGVKWAVLNKKYRRDYAKAMEEAGQTVEKRGVSVAELRAFTKRVMTEIKKAGFERLGGYTQEGKIAVD